MPKRSHSISPGNEEDNSDKRRQENCVFDVAQVASTDFTTVIDLSAWLTRANSLSSFVSSSSHRSLPAVGPPSSSSVLREHISYAPRFAAPPLSACASRCNPGKS